MNKVKLYYTWVQKNYRKIRTHWRNGKQDKTYECLKVENENMKTM